MLGGINLKSEFLKSVVILTSGTVLAQLVHLIFMPIIMGIYNDEQFGELNLFLRIVGFVSAIATARYELSIPLPKRHSHAFQLLRLSLRVALFTLLASVIGGLVFWFIQDWDSNVLLYLVALVIVTFLTIFRNVYVNWSIRMKQFKLMSYSKVIGALGMSGSKIGLGLAGFGAPGLIVATLLGVLIGTILYIFDFFKTVRNIEFISNRKKEKALAKEHQDFPKVNLPHTLLDTGRELLIAIFVVEFFDKEVFGSFSQVIMLLNVPLVLVGATIGQAFFQKSAEMVSNKQKLFPLLKRTTLILFSLAIIPFSIIFFFGQEILVWFTSDEWMYGGLVMELLVPWIMIQFVASPISTIPLVIKKQKTFFWLGLGNTALQLFMFGVVPFFLDGSSSDALNLFWWLSIVVSVYLVFVILVKLKLVYEFDKRH